MMEATTAASSGEPLRFDPAVATPAPFPLPATAHLLFAFWIAAMVGLGLFAPARYETLLQEDRFIEWWTVPLFAGAGFLALRRAWTHRRPFDALVGAFCVFIAGEEFSWGQRLLGFVPPAPFLEHNFQQELTLHNFADIFGQPKWVLVGALVGFGVLLPLVVRTSYGTRLVRRVGATVPRIAALPWFVAAIVLLIWYPLSYTGEWVETLAGGLFLGTFAQPRRAATVAGVGALLAFGLTAWSGRGAASAAEIECAHAEVQSIARDLAYGRAATGRLAGARSVHKRMFTAGQEGYVDIGELTVLEDTACPIETSTAQRRQHAIDPWGTAYWVSVTRGADIIALRVYSFGPNRRRDGGSMEGAGDDVGARIVIRP